MDPPRRPESGWLQNAGANSKNQPTLAPTPDPSQITRAAPLPADLIARDGGDPENEEAERAGQAKKAAEEQKEEEEEELCAICYDQLPDVGRGVIACGHVYCFTCIHQWCKTQNDCPGCRYKVRRILKTLSPEDVSKENERKKQLFRKRFKNKKQRERAKRRAGRVKTQTNIVTKTVRIRPATLRPTPAQQRAEPHPEAPGGWMRAEAQEAARQRLQIQLQQQQQLHHQLQPRRIQPVQAQGVLAEMAEFMRVAEEGGLSDEVEASVRDQAAAARPPSPFHRALAVLERARAAMRTTREQERARRSSEVAEEERGFEREARRDQRATGGGSDGSGGGSAADGTSRLTSGWSS